MENSYEAFKNRAAGIQSYMIVIAIAIGGVWAVFQFVSSHYWFVQAQVNVKVAAREERLPNGQRSVIAVVELTNTGNRNVF